MQSTSNANIQSRVLHTRFEENAPGLCLCREESQNICSRYDLIKKKDSSINLYSLLF